MRRRQFTGDVIEGDLTVLCAWCGMLLTQGGQRISHGICSRCARGFEREIEAFAARTSRN